IPASGPVAVTAIRNKPVLPHSTRGVTGTLAGVHGTMRETSGGGVTFTRTSVGDAILCPPGSRFTPEDGLEMRDRQVTIWAGRNDVYPTDPALVVSAIRAQIDYLSPSVKRAMVMEVMPAETTPATHE